MLLAAVPLTSHNLQSIESKAPDLYLYTCRSSIYILSGLSYR